MSSFTRGAKVVRGGGGSGNVNPQSQSQAAAPSDPSNITAASTQPTITNVTASPSPSTTTNSSTSGVSPSLAPSSATPNPVQSVRPSAAGCRSWIHGLTLTSTGVSGVDGILGGGIPLGSVFGLKEDTHTDSYATVSCLTPFIQSFIADGIGFGHRVLVVHEGSHSVCDAWLSTLPRNLTLEKRQTDAAAEEQALKESAAAQQQHDLKIAWRYQQYMERPLDTKANLGAHKVTGGAPTSGTRSVSSATLSASYDYHSTISSQLLHSNPPTVLSIQDDILPLLPSYDVEPTLTDGHRNALLYRHILERVAIFIASAPPGSVSRILLHSLGSAGWCLNTETQHRPIQIFLAHLRQLIASQSVLVMFSLTTALLSPSLVRLLSHSSDIVLSLSGFSISSASASAAILGDYDGIMRIERFASRHTLQSSQVGTGVSSSSSSSASSEDGSSAAASSHCYLFKLTRRKIIIEKFALPPDIGEEENNSTAAPKPSIPGGTSAPIITTRGTNPNALRQFQAKESQSSPIAYEASDESSNDSLASPVTGQNLARHGSTGTKDPSTSSATRAVRDSSLQAILHGRSTLSGGCSGTHQLKGNMDF